MATWILIIIGFITLLITNGAFFYSINRKMKKAEVQEKEIEIIKKQDDEWLELYHEEKLRRTELEEKVRELFDKLDCLYKAKGMLELKNQQLNWYRCTVNNCPNRRPPHVFDANGVELEACDNK